MRPFRDLVPFSISPEGRAAISMSLAMAVHFFGYEFARSGSLSLFTSSKTGFNHSSAFPMAMACVSPLSFLMVLGYGQILEHNGPKSALRYTTILSALVISFSALLASLIEKNEMNNKVTISWNIPYLEELSLCKLIVGMSFIFSNSYAHLLYTQHWSFLGSILTASQGTTYFAVIGGLSSVSSSIAGVFLSKVVDRIGLPGLLGIASLSLIMSALFGDLAYSISEKNGFDPSEEIKQKRLLQSTKKSNTQRGTIKRALNLFNRVPILGMVFCEVVSFQMLCSVLNMCFVSRLKYAIQSDSERAAWTGNFYALVNGLSGLFQFIILPLFLKNIELKWVWRVMPMIPLISILAQYFQGESSFYFTAFCLFSVKSIDYSIRNVVNELVFMSLDFESRYLGKEVIGVFGNRLGKSGISLFLFCMPHIFKNFGIETLTHITALAAVCWLVCAHKLSNHLPSKIQVEEVRSGKKVA